MFEPATNAGRESEYLPHAAPLRPRPGPGARAPLRLERFKAKFEPARWNPITALTNEPASIPLTLGAIADVFSGEGVSPVRFIGGALLNALKQEVRTLDGLLG